MKIAKSSRILSPIERWQQLPNGMNLLAQTQDRIRQYLPCAFGYHLLKIGHLSSAIDTSESTILHQINCAPSGNKIGLFADFKDLPLKKSSIDLCILAHEHNFSSDPHQLLREIERVLTLDGILIISGYNPISYFGLRSIFKSKNQLTARLFSPNRVIDWLHLLGFEIQQKQHFGFLGGYNPSKNKGYLSACIEKFGLRYSPVFCSVYFLVAKKQSVPMRPIISPFTFTKKTIIGGQAAATRNSASKSSHTVPFVT